MVCAVRKTGRGQRVESGQANSLDPKLKVDASRERNDDPVDEKRSNLLRSLLFILNGFRDRGVCQFESSKLVALKFDTEYIVNMNKLPA